MTAKIRKERSEYPGYFKISWETADGDGGTMSVPRNMQPHCTGLVCSRLRPLLCELSGDALEERWQEMVRRST